MADLTLAVEGWLAPEHGEPEVRAATGNFSMTAGPDGDKVGITDVEDLAAQTVRSHIRVPLVPLAEWLLANWWRLRWEPRPPNPSFSWYEAHRLSAVGGDTPWPPIEISSDGEYIHLQMSGEESADVSAIRYLRDVHVEIPASEFEAAVDSFLDTVEARLAATGCSYDDVAELREELRDERQRSSVARTCRWQALAGIDPGSATEKWLQRAQTIVEDVGDRAGDELMATLPELDEGLASAAELVKAMRQSPTAVDLSWVSDDASLLVASPSERPWQKGARLASAFRDKHGLSNGPIKDNILSDLVRAPVPLQGNIVRDAALGGGVRNGVSHGRTHLLLPSRRVESQRFFLARMIAAAHVLDPGEHLLPVTRADSAMQKLARSFAQELLCPWQALDAFTDDRGVHDEALADAADHFRVSEWLVRSTLVNRGKMSRKRLPRQLR